MSSNLKVNTILPSTGTAIGIGTASGNINVLGHIVGDNTSNISGINSVTATTFYGSGANLTNIPAQATIANNADNRVITGGSGVNLNGESTLTYDGDGLLTMTSSSGPAELTLVAPSANDSGIYFNDGSNDGAISYDHSTRNMNFRANSQTKFRIEGDTKTLKIQRPDSSAVDIVLAKAQRWGYSNSWQGLIIGNPAVGNMSSLFLNYDPSSNTSGSFGGDGREIVVRKNAKIIVPNNADNNFFNAIEFNCGGSRDDGVSRFRQGIIVSNDSADANVLDDYEEGSCSVTLVGQYGGNANYSYRAGYYTRIGRVVHYVGDVRFNGSWSGSSGNLYLQLPFGTSFASGGTVGNGTVAEWNLSNSNWDWIGLQLDNNAANAKFTSHSGSNNNTSYLQTGELGNGRWLKFGLTYITS